VLDDCDRLPEANRAGVLAMLNAARKCPAGLHPSLRRPWVRRVIKSVLGLNAPTRDHALRVDDFKTMPSAYAI
jgi:hypothetical protein